ncbi:MAG: cysteine desulfurase [Butyrivibrio sp.]|nr:cysteine desulfurase [Butyrivibrio sp.]
MIYLDNAATTPMDRAVLEAMIPFYENNFYNPSAFYQASVKTKMQVESARRKIAGLLKVPADTIFFTSGGTESDNWAVRLGAFSEGEKKKHIITSAIEHPAVLNTMKYMQEKGYEVTYLKVDRNGIVDLDELKSAIRKDTILISVMHANNEVGSIQPIKEIGEIASQNGILFHTDAVQTFGHIPIDIEDCHIDLLSVSAHKLYGPKGIGFLYIRNRKDFGKLLFGGSQEKSLRPGTENVPGIIGMSKAAELSYERMDSDYIYIENLRELFIHKLKEVMPEIVVNGSPINHLPGTANITFGGITGESLLIALDQQGICASAGSACSAGAIEPSHVLMAMGLSAKEASRTLRFSFGRCNTKEDVINTINSLKSICHV